MTKYEMLNYLLDKLGSNNLVVAFTESMTDDQFFMITEKVCKTYNIDNEQDQD